MRNLWSIYSLLVMRVLKSSEWLLAFMHGFVCLQIDMLQMLKSSDRPTNPSKTATEITNCNVFQLGLEDCSAIRKK